MTHQLLAAITNPVVQSQAGPNAADQAKKGELFTSYFIMIWQSLISIGAIVVIFYFLWGALEWIYAGGDSGKIQKARDKITQAIIGMVLLVGSFVIIGLISSLFFSGMGFDILNFSLTNSGSSPTGTTQQNIPGAPNKFQPVP